MCVFFCLLYLNSKMKYWIGCQIPSFSFKKNFFVPFRLFLLVVRSQANMSNVKTLLKQAQGFFFKSSEMKVLRKFYPVGRVTLETDFLMNNDSTNSLYLHRVLLCSKNFQLPSVTLSR